MEGPDVFYNRPLRKYFTIFNFVSVQIKLVFMALKRLGLQKCPARKKS